MARRRADLLLQLRGLAESRSKAQALILAGEVVAGDHRVDKPGQLLDEGVELRLKSGEALKYVSRGGAKLEHALDTFGLDPRALVCCGQFRFGAGHWFAFRETLCFVARLS